MIPRTIAAVVLMTVLLVIYGVHPVAGWAALTMMFGTAMFARRRKAMVALRD